MSLRARLSVIGITVLACTVAVVAVLAYEFSRIQGRGAVDDLLRQELTALGVGLPDLIADQATGTTATDEEVFLAVRRYLATHPGSTRHLTIIRVGGQEFTTRDGPDEVLELLEDGAVPVADPGELQTVSTPEGSMRVLAAPLTGPGAVEIGQVLVLAPLDAVLDDARDTLARIATAGAVGLIIGGAALTLATGRALAPMRRLAEVARSTGANDLSARAPEIARRDEVGVVTHEFNRMLDRIAVDHAQRQQLLAAISHELRTPVAVAIGHLEVFETLGPDDQHTAGQLTGVLRTELDRLSRLVDDLSAFAKGSLGSEIELAPVFVSDVLQDLRDRLAGLGLLSVKVSEPPPAVIEADPGRVAQCLLNLVVNADSHTPSGTQISVDAYLTASHVCLTVTDDGPGIEPRIADRVFEAFVTTRDGGTGRSTGLGLAIVRVLTEAQGGTVELSTATTGTKVSLCFPIPRTDDP